MNVQDTIVALASPAGAGAIAVIRVSGNEAIAICATLFKSIKGKNLVTQKTHTIHLGHIVDGDRVIDQVLVSLFKGTNSYTGEPTVEISCHGSNYIQQEIIQLLLRSGCRAAKAGEFTLRSFINGKMDLSQAEAVADLIASDNEASHQIAMQQMRGGFSNEIAQLRQELLNFASLIELELDFSEEDVEFADRSQFKELIARITKVLKRLIDSFATGNVIKNGIPVAIVGEPNVGKSTLLNALLNEERAIVSNIAGTTRDTIEDELTIGGISFRFIDTAGIRETKDVIEGLGIKKTFEKISQSSVTIYLFDATTTQNNTFDINNLIVEIEKIKNKFPLKPLLVIANKIDQLDSSQIKTLTSQISNLHLLSAKENIGVDELKTKLLDFVNTGALRNDCLLYTSPSPRD